MPARLKGRAKFDFKGRSFTWWVDADRWLRIASLDKRFVVAFPMEWSSEESPQLVIHGPEFPGISRDAGRPLNIAVPLPNGPMGKWVDHLLGWCFDEKRMERKVHE